VSPLTAVARRQVLIVRDKLPAAAAAAAVAQLAAHWMIHRREKQQTYSVEQCRQNIAEQILID